MAIPKYECEGQMTIFDFIEAESVAESSQQRINAIEQRELLRGSDFENGRTRIFNYFKEEHTEKEYVEFLKHEYGVGGGTIPEGMSNHDAKGIDIKLDEPIGKCTGIHIGWPMAARRIKELVKKGIYQADVCRFSNHTCNKKELWKIADTLDEIVCPHVCCRMCNERLCGSRCNGAEIKEDYTYDRAGRKHDVPKWMNYRRCENCQRWQRYDINEQPPDGWGVMGYCMEHKYKCTKTNICNDFDEFATILMNLQRF